MNALERYTTPQRDLVAQNQVPDAASFRATQADRLAGDALVGTTARLWGIRRWPDGTCDLVPYDCDGTDYLDLGGHGSHVVAAGRY